MKTLHTALLTAGLAIGTLGMVGCQTTPTAPNYNAGTQHAISSQLLQSYDWQLVDAKYADGKQITPLFYNPAKPLTLRFSTEVSNQANENRVAFMNTCNNLGAAYAVRNGSVELSNMLSTMRACPDAEARFDTATTQVVQGKYSVHQQGNQAPVLTIKGTNTVAHFKAVAK